MLEQAVILCGGKGTRLGELTQDVPKPMMQIGNIVFLDFVIQNLTRFGIRKILLIAGHLGEQIQERYDHAVINGASCKVIIENEPLGTGGFLYAFTDWLEDEFILLNGDTLFDFNLSEFIKSFEGKSSLVHIATKDVVDTTRYGAMKITGDIVTNFDEKNSAHLASGQINSGTYIIKKNIINYFHRTDITFISLEHEILPELVKGKCISAHSAKNSGYFIDIGIPETLNEARNSLFDKLTKPACFLDRDNTLNRDKGYTYKKSDLIWMPGAREAIKYLNDSGFYVFVVSNQSGIGRGYYTDDDVRDFHHEMRMQLRTIGAHIDDFVFCPHVPILEHSASICCCRKPAPGLLLELQEKWPIDKANSLMIGDKESDLEAGYNAGIISLRTDGSDLLSLILSYLENANVNH